MSGHRDIDDDDLLLAACWLLLDSEDDENERKKIKPRYTKEAAGECTTSPFQHFLVLSDDPTYCFLFHVKKKHFYKLLEKFTEPWTEINLHRCNGEYVEGQRQRPRKATPALVLALVLRFLTTTTEGTDSAYSFGMIPSTYSRHLRHGLHCLRKVFKESFPFTQYGTLDYDRLQFYLQVIEIQSKGVLHGIWGMVDRIVLHFERSADAEVENVNYSGFKRCPGKKMVCCFAPDGSICSAVWALGSEHDSALWVLLAAVLLHIGYYFYGATRAR